MDEHRCHLVVTYSEVCGRISCRRRLCENTEHTLGGESISIDLKVVTAVANCDIRLRGTTVEGVVQAVTQDSALARIFEADHILEHSLRGDLLNRVGILGNILHLNPISLR